MRDDDEGFGELIKTARRNLGLSQGELAGVMDVSQQSVSRWEKGDVPPLKVLAHLAKTLGIPMGELARYQRPAMRTTADRLRELEEFAEVLKWELAELKAAMH